MTEVYEDAIARERIAALDRLMTQGFAAQERATQIALGAAEKAVVKAEAATEKRFDGVNEFRQALGDQAARLISRAEVDALLGGVNATLARLELAAAASAGRGLGAGSLWSLISAGLLLVIAAGGLAAAVWGG